MPSNDVEITAVYTVNSYTITFDSQGGTAVTAITQDYLTNVSATNCTKKNNYIFVDWYTDNTFTTHMYLVQCHQMILPLFKMDTNANGNSNDYQ